MLIHYRILSSQFELVFTAIIFTLTVFRRGITLTHAVGWWVILATLEGKSALHGLVLRYHTVAESHADATTRGGT